MINFNALGNLTFGDVLCALGSDFCIIELNWPLPIPNFFTQFDSTVIPSSNSLFIVPFFGALLVSTIQVFLGIRDTKKHLIEIYKGKCVYLPPIKQLKNKSIAGSSFHYGGYLTGYLIWGFMIQYIMIVLIGFVIFILRYSIGSEIFLHIFLKILPVIVVLIVK